MMLMLKIQMEVRVRIQTNNGNVSIVDDNGNITQEFPLEIGEDIVAKESGTIVLGVNENKNFTFNGVDLVNGVMINSDNLVSLDINGATITGENIYLTRVYTESLSISNIGRHKISGEILGINSGSSIITPRTPFLSYSVLVGGTVHEPFNLQGESFLFKMENRAIIEITLYGEAGIDITTGNGVANALEDVINSVVSGSDIVSVEYIGDHFEITSEVGGKVRMMFLDEGYNTSHLLGMESPELFIGGTIEPGYYVRMTTGANSGNEYEITSIDGDGNLTLSGSVTGLAVGDKYIIIDKSQESTINYLVYQ